MLHPFVVQVLASMYNDEVLILGPVPLYNLPLPMLVVQVWHEGEPTHTHTHTEREREREICST